MSQLNRFSILGLFGEKDIHLDLSENVTILIADNGVGKTTILGIVYAVLSGRFSRLRRTEFREIQVEFKDGRTVRIPSELVLPPLQIERANPRLRRLLHEIPESALIQLFEETRGASYLEFRRHPLAQEIIEITSIPARYIYDALRSAYRPHQLELIEGETSPEDVRNKIQEAFASIVLYFPTYRRIEEELEQLGYERKERMRSEALIQFGMGDVHHRIVTVTDEIKKSSIAWFSKINGQMLSQLVDGFHVDDPTRESLNNVDALRIVLDRIGSNISNEHKAHIIELVEEGAINQQKHDYLAYFLSNLIKIYDQQRILDNSIKDFTNVCNKYLVDKKIVYDESAVEVGIFSETTGKSIDLTGIPQGMAH
ncbi:MAG: AAA family ATPase, partial [Bdellovibrionales bacterium]|nr:AAA family ATPase [Bdellovibrionales bacterium]